MTLPYRVAPHPDGRKGRAMFATRDFRPGEHIHVFERPMVVLPVQGLHHEYCAECLQRRQLPALFLSSCGRCKAVWYCSKECQRNGWKRIHRKECPHLQKRDTLATAPKLVRALIQLLSEPALCAHAVANLYGLPVELSSAQAVARDYPQLYAIASEVVQILELPVAKLVYVAQLASRVQLNAFDVRDLDVHEQLFFLHDQLAMANHSCLPNAAVHIHRRQALMVAERPIAAGQEITISYTDHMQSQAMRQEYLNEYHFTCHCERCQHEESPPDMKSHEGNGKDNKHKRKPDHAPPPFDVYEMFRIRAPEVVAVDPLRFSMLSPAEMLRPPPILPTSLTEGELSAMHHAYRLSQHDPRFREKTDDESTRVRIAQLTHQYQLLRPLVLSRRWACHPLPPFLYDCLSYFVGREDAFVEALAVAALMVVRWYPYAVLLPQSPLLLKGYLTVHGLLQQGPQSGEEMALGLRATAARWGIDPVFWEQLVGVDTLGRTEQAHGETNHGKRHSQKGKAEKGKTERGRKESGKEELGTKNSTNGSNGPGSSTSGQDKTGLDDGQLESRRTRGDVLSSCRPMVLHQMLSYAVYCSRLRAHVPDWLPSFSDIPQTVMRYHAALKAHERAADLQDDLFRGKVVEETDLAAWAGLMEKKTVATREKPCSREPSVTGSERGSTPSSPRRNGSPAEDVHAKAHAQENTGEDDAQTDQGPSARVLQQVIGEAERVWRRYAVDPLTVLADLGERIVDTFFEQRAGQWPA